MDWKQFDAVIFDMDGVVVDTEDIHFQAFRRVFKTYDIELDQEHFVKFVGHTTSRNIQDINEEFNVNFDIPTMVKEQRAAFEKILESAGVDACPGVWTLIETLKSLNIKTGLCTSSSRNEAEYMFAKILQNHPEYRSIADVFDTSVTAFDVTHRKPHPEPYGRAMSNLAVEPDKCLVFEDSAMGIESARTAGCGMVIALRHHYNRDKLGGADWAIDSLEELI